MPLPMGPEESFVGTVREAVFVWVVEPSGGVTLGEDVAGWGSGVVAGWSESGVRVVGV